MNKTAFTKRWTALFAVFLLVISNLVFVQPVGHAATLESAVTIKAIDENGEIVLPLTSVQIDDGDTAENVLREAVEKADLEIDAPSSSSMGAYINSIGGVSPPEGTYFWSFNVNGVSAPLGISNYPVKNGENLLFAISDWTTPSETTAKVSAAGKDGVDVIPETEVTLVEGASAYDALVQAATQQSLEVQASVDDTYFTFVNNIGNLEMGANDWWGIAVNDRDLSTSVVAHTLQANDHVQLTLQTYEPANPTDPEEPTEPGTEEPQEPADPNEVVPITNQEVETSVSEILSYIDDNKISFTYGQEWWVWGLANTTREIPASYVTSVGEKVKELEGNFRIFDLEKIIIGLSAAGTDATSIEGHNLIDSLVTHSNLANPSINMNIYALLAVDSGQYETPEGFREQQVNEILAQELEQGGWSLFGSTPSPDITGMVLTALAPYRDQADVQAAIDRAVAYLSAAQDETGGYNVSSNGGDASESVSQVIVGLASVGVDPTGEVFTKAGGNLVQHLLKFKNEDGGFSHLQAGNSGDMPTQQALLALTAYQSFVNGGGSVYQFEVGNEVEQPGQPEQPEQPEQPGQPEKPEQPEQPAPSEQEQPEGTDKAGSPSPSTDDENPKQSSKSMNESGKKLPNTATNTGNIMIFGLSILLVGVGIFYVNRKRAA